jgi:hypothetical protein
MNVWQFWCRSYPRRSIFRRGFAEKARLDKAIEEDVSKLPVSMRDKEKMSERYGIGKDPRLPSLGQVYEWIRQRQEEVTKSPTDKKVSRQVTYFRGDMG